MKQEKSLSKTTVMVQLRLLMVHQYEKGVVYHSFFVLIRVWGSAEPLQDASKLLVFTLLVHLAPRSAKGDARISCPLARTKNREGVVKRLLLCLDPH